MFIRVPSHQIPIFWETIKWVLSEIENLESKKERQLYFNETLHTLLSDKAQCWVRLNEKRELLMLGLTRLIIDKVWENKTLFIQTLYSWQNVPFQEWQAGYNLIKQFAQIEKCKQITFDSPNPRIRQLAESVGFQESYRHYSIEVEKWEAEVQAKKLL